MNASTTKQQSPHQSNYPAIDLLHRASNDLPKYQYWITGLFAKVADQKAVKDVLDFGCGTGVLSQNFSRITFSTPIGVEIDEKLRAYCQLQGLKVFPNLEAVDRKFDLIFSSNVLEHIEDDSQTLKSLHQVMKPDAKLALFLPAFPILWSKMDEQVGHFRRYRARTLCKILTEQGFVIERCRYYDSAGFFMSLLYKFLPARDGQPSNFSLRIFDNFIFPISKIFDVFFGSILGKNVFVVARRL